MGLLKHVETFNIQKKKKGIGGRRQWRDDCLIFPSSSLSFCRHERNRAPGVRDTTAHSLSPMPGTMSQFFLLLSDLGLLFPSFFFPFLITSSRLSGVVDGPRVKLELGREQPWCWKAGDACVHPQVPPHTCAWFTDLALEELCFVVSVCECLCTKGCFNHVLHHVPLLEK